MDFTGLGTLVTAVFAGVGVVIVALNGRGKVKAPMDEEDRGELRDLRDWRPAVLRWYAAQRAKMAAVADGPELDPLPPYPLPGKQAKDDHGK